jgi:zinc transporter, ZIP family
VLEGTSTNVALGLVAGMTIFLGLPIARLKGASEAVKGMLALASAGVLMFLIIEVGYHAIEIVEGTAKGGDLNLTLFQGSIMTFGLLLGLVGLAVIEERRHQARNQGATPLDIASMIALGIGLHNFAEGLAIGQSYSSGNTALGLVLVLGFALHNATEGFGIAAPLAGTDVSWSKLIGLGLIGGAPTALGSALGGSFVNTNFELFILSLAVGSLIYVTRELLRLRFASLSTSKGMLALTIGLVVGIATEIYIEAASVNNQPEQAFHKGAAKKISFEDKEVEPNQLTVARGEYLLLVNKTNKALEIEAKGLINKEAFVPQNGEVTIQVIGTPGKYSLSPENSSLLAQIIVVPGQQNMQQADTERIIAALTIIAGHAQAAYDLHLDSFKAACRYPLLDLARAAKHSYHPVHEIFEDETPQSLLVQTALQKVGLLDPLKKKLEQYSKLAGNGKTSSEEFANSYADLIATVEKSRRLIGGEYYDNPTSRRKAALIVLQQAEDEYKEAVESGHIVVLKAAQPGKDGYLEYQDTKGFLRATRDMLMCPTDQKCASAQEAIENLLGNEFKNINPENPEHPVPFTKIEKDFEAIEKILD